MRSKTRGHVLIEMGDATRIHVLAEARKLPALSRLRSAAEAVASGDTDDAFGYLHRVLARSTLRSVEELTLAAECLPYAVHSEREHRAATTALRVAPARPAREPALVAPGLLYAPSVAGVLVLLALTAVSSLGLYPFDAATELEAPGAALGVFALVLGLWLVKSAQRRVDRTSLTRACLNGLTLLRAPEGLQLACEHLAADANPRLRVAARETVQAIVDLVRPDDYGEIGEQTLTCLACAAQADPGLPLLVLLERVGRSESIAPLARILVTASPGQVRTQAEKALRAVESRVAEEALRATLLRPAQPPHCEMLVRPASLGVVRTDTLVRPARSAEELCVSDAPEPRLEQQDVASVRPQSGM